MRSGLYLLFLLLPASTYCADLNLTVQAPWQTQSFYPLVSLGLLMRSERNQFTYFEVGLSSLPRFTYSTTKKNVSFTSDERLYSLYGIYGGYYFLLMPIFRPGIIAGTVLNQKAFYSGSSDKPFEIKPPTLNYYAGISVHVFLLTFIVTNQGIGGGINLNL